MPSSSACNLSVRSRVRLADLLPAPKSGGRVLPRVSRRIDPPRRSRIRPTLRHYQGFTFYINKSKPLFFLGVPCFQAILPCRWTLPYPTVSPWVLKVRRRRCPGSFSRLAKSGAKFPAAFRSHFRVPVCARSRRRPRRPSKRSRQSRSLFQVGSTGLLARNPQTGCLGACRNNHGPFTRPACHFNPWKVNKLRRKSS
jgi:hypothetical protein